MLILEIAFLLLLFFLLTSTIEQPKGLVRRLPPLYGIIDYGILDFNERDILRIHVNGSNKLLVNGVQMECAGLKETVKAFILNPSNDESMSQKEEKIIMNLTTPVMVSKAILVIQTDRNTSYNTYIKVQNEVAKAYNELRNAYALATFSKNYPKLSKNEQQIVLSIYPLNMQEVPAWDNGI